MAWRAAGTVTLVGAVTRADLPCCCGAADLFRWCRDGQRGLQRRAREVGVGGGVAGRGGVGAVGLWGGLRLGGGWAGIRGRMEVPRTRVLGGHFPPESGGVQVFWREWALRWWGATAGLPSGGPLGDGPTVRPWAPWMEAGWVSRGG